MLKAEFDTSLQSGLWGFCLAGERGSCHAARAERSFKCVVSKRLSAFPGRALRGLRGDLTGSGGAQDCCGFRGDAEGKRHLQHEFTCHCQRNRGEDFLARHLTLCSRRWNSRRRKMEYDCLHYYTSPWIKHVARFFIISFFFLESTHQVFAFVGVDFHFSFLSFLPFQCFLINSIF